MEKTKEELIAMINQIDSTDILIYLTVIVSRILKEGC